MQQQQRSQHMDSYPSVKQPLVPRLAFGHHQSIDRFEDFPSCSQSSRDVLYTQPLKTIDACNSTAMQSTRTYNAAIDTHNPSPLLTGRQYLENTLELKAFVTIDLAKINKDRQNQLKLALEDNLREKETQIKDVISSYQQQKAEYDRVSQTLEASSRELDGEIARQREHIQTLKRRAAKMDAEQQQIDIQHQQYSDQHRQAVEDLEISNQGLKEAIRNHESELQMIRFDRQSVEAKIELRKRVRMQELDIKVLPLNEDRDQIALQLDLLNQNLKILQDVQMLNDNEKSMIEEDLSGSNQAKVDLIYQREEIEQYIEKTKIDNPDIRFVSSQNLVELESDQAWEQVLQRLINEKQCALLLDLIRELHQYILGLSSNTTDNSVMQSDELEELQFMIEKRAVSSADAVQMIASFAQSKIKLDLNAEALQDKLDCVCEIIDSDTIRLALSEISGLESQMIEIDQRIKVITNRCQNELAPRYKALTISDSQMRNDIVQVQENIDTVRQNLSLIDLEIEQVQRQFEQTLQLHGEYVDSDDIEDLEGRLYELQSQIDGTKAYIAQMIEELEYNQQRIEELSNQMKEVMSQLEERRTQIQSEYASVCEEIKKEKTNSMQYEFTNPLVQQITRVVAQLKCDKESASKRLKYIEAKMSTSQETLLHAKSVLDTHILQIQQETLHQKVNQSTSNVKRRNTSSMNLTECQKQGGQRRVPNIQQKSISITHGKLLSPGRIAANGSCSPRHGENTKTELIPQRIHQCASVMDYGRDQYSHINGDRMKCRSHFIEPDEPAKSEVLKHHSKAKDSGNNNTLNQKHREMIKQYLEKDKSVSAADLVKYRYDSSVMLSSQEELQSIQSNHQDKLRSRGIPIQNFITPREAPSEMQYNHSHQISQVSQPTQYELAFGGNYAHNASIGSADSSVGASLYQKQPSEFQTLMQSIQSNEDFQTIQSLQNTYQGNQARYQPVPQIKISLRQSQNSSIDAGRGSINSSTQYKENIAPNSISHTMTLNMRKLSQAASLSSLHSTASNSKPPAVPGSKLPTHHQQQQFISMNTGDSSKKRSGTARSKAHIGYPETNIISSQSSSQFNSNRQSTNQIQTKMRLCQNSNNGKILAVGIVDLSRCNQNLLQRDIQFFDSVKPLVEGAQFLCLTRHGQCHAKHIFLDFSLLRLFIASTSNSTMNGDRREILMVESILKTELPNSTLEMIKQDKLNVLTESYHSEHMMTQQSKRYEFHLILSNNGGMAERMQLLSHSYDELRQWIIGVNALIGNKNNLMRLSSLIKT